MKKKKLVKGTYGAIVPNIIRGGNATPLGNNLYWMSGRSHAAGGIDIGKNLEVEGNEVVQMSPNEVRVFSGLPMLNGFSPAELVANGNSPNVVFNAQEQFKKINRIKDDGTKYIKGGKTSYNSTPESVALDRMIDSSAPASNYLDSLDFNINPKLLAKYVLNKTAGVVEKYSNYHIPSGLSNCTLTASQWVHPDIPIGSARSIVNNPKRYKYYKVTPEYAIPGSLVIASYNLNDTEGSDNSYHTMMISGYAPKDYQYDFNGNTYYISKGEPLVSYSKGGNNEQDLVKNIPLNVYLKNSEGHDILRYYRPLDNQGIGNVLLPNIDVISNKKQFGGKMNNNRSVSQNKIGTIVRLDGSGRDKLSYIPFTGWKQKANITDAVNTNYSDIMRYGGKRRKAPLGTYYGRSTKNPTYMYNPDILFGHTLSYNSPFTIGSAYPPINGTPVNDTWYNTRTDTYVTPAINEDGSVTKALNLGIYNGDSAGNSVFEYMRAHNGNLPPRNNFNSQPNLASENNWEYTKLPIDDWRNVNWGTKNVPNNNSNNVGNDNTPSVSSPKLPSSVLSAPNTNISNKYVNVGTGSNKNDSPTMGELIGMAKDAVTQDAWGNVIAGGANVLGSLIGGLLNNSIYNKYKYTPRPIPAIAAKLKTRYNINPQLDELREAGEIAKRDTSRNTSSSHVARTLTNAINQNRALQAAKLYGEKENKETELINADKLNRQNISKENVENYNKWVAHITDEKNKVMEGKITNIGNMINGIINGGVGITNGLLNRKSNLLNYLFALKPLLNTYKGL